MPKVLTLLMAVGVTWTVSQYLPLDKLARDSQPATEIATSAIPVMVRASAGSRSVALIDFAVAALPGTSQSALADDTPAIVVAAVVPPLPERAGVTAETTESGGIADATATALAANAGEPVDPAAHARLARDIQKQLRRVGCLKAAADGVWGDATKRAMQRFADRIEADLPVDQPDDVLLMLVDNFDDRACGAPCKAGEVPNARGRCRPVEVMAAAEPAPPARTRTASLTDEVVEKFPNEASQAAEPEHSPMKWLPGSSKKMRQTKKPERVSEPVGSETTLEATAAAPAPKAANRSRAAGQARIVKTSISRVHAPKRARLVASSRKTRWSQPRYGLGVVNAKPGKATAKVRKKHRTGAAAAYRRWMKRNAFSMR